MLSGLVAGVASFVVAYLLGEGPLSAGISYEAGAALPDAGVAAEGHSHEISRTVQSTIGLASALLFNGLAVGGLAGLAFATALGRLGGLGPRGTAVAVTGTAFVCGFLVPFLKYPANPPGATDGASVGQRTAGYFAMVGISLLLAIAAYLVAEHLQDRWGWWTSGVLAIIGYAGAVAIVMALLPSAAVPPADFPATDLWDFRLATIAVQATVWFVFGAAFGARVPQLLSAPAAPGDRVSASHL